MKTKSIIIFSFLFIAAVTILVGVFYTYKIFEVVRINKGIITLKHCKIHLDYLPGNATAQYFMQVKVSCRSDEIILKNMELFSSIESTRIINDSLLEVTFADSTFSMAREIDTLIIPSCCR